MQQLSVVRGLGVSLDNFHEGSGSHGNVRGVKMRAEFLEAPVSPLVCRGLKVSFITGNTLFVVSMFNFK